MIGRRLKLARTAAGLSLRDLEAKIGNRVTAQAIGKYERNESVPSSGVLIALGSALDVSVNYLVGDESLVLEGIEFRKKKIVGRKQEARVGAIILRQLERYLVVEDLLGLPTTDWNPYDAPYRVAEMAETESAAQGLRSAWGLGLDPIPNMVELLEARGIKVMTIDLGEIDGLTARVHRPGRRATRVVVVNSTHTGERQRFTLAHELGHIVIEVVPHLKAEGAAQRFAGAFLMPAQSLRSEIGRHRTSVSLGELFDLKAVFRVSVQALTHRCRDLGIINNALHQRLFTEFARRGWRSPPYNEPSITRPERTTRFERLCFRALAESAISAARAAELVGVPVHELDRMMDEPPEDRVEAPGEQWSPKRHSARTTALQ